MDLAAATLHRLGLDYSMSGVAAPVIAASNAVKLARETGKRSAYEVGLDAVGLMDQGAFAFGRGMACGLAMMMTVEERDAKTRAKIAAVEEEIGALTGEIDALKISTEDGLRARFGLPDEDRASFESSACRIAAHAIDAGITFAEIKDDEAAATRFASGAMQLPLDVRSSLASSVPQADAYLQALAVMFTGIVTMALTEHGAA